MTTKITATELAKSLSDVLNRVRYKGERFIVERGGVPIAEIRPAGPKPGVTWGELVEVLRNLPRLDKEFLDDLEEIKRSQMPPKPPEWP